MDTHPSPRMAPLNAGMRNSSFLARKRTPTGMVAMWNGASASRLPAGSTIGRTLNTELLGAASTRSPDAVA